MIMEAHTTSESINQNEIHDTKEHTHKLLLRFIH